MTQETEPIKEEFLQLSLNILGTMPRLRPPVAYYILNEIKGMQKICEAEERINVQKAEEIEKFCTQGDLFLNKQDYKTFAQYLSKDLGILLVQDDIDPKVAATTFYMALEREVLAFFAHTNDESFEELKKNMAILCEYIWADSARAFSLLQAMDYQHSLGRHSVNSCLLGIAIYTVMNQDKLASKLLEVATGLLVHDIGMNHVPDFIRNKKGPLLNKEKIRVKEHTTSGLKSMQRLTEPFEEMLVCIEQHQERINGSGYPRSLKEDAIHPIAKICALADSFCAMRSNRIYARSVPFDDAIGELMTNPGYDKKCINALLKVCDAAGLAEQGAS